MKVKIGDLQFDSSLDDLTNREAIELKKVTGIDIGEFNAALGRVDPTAWTGLVYIHRRRTEPDLRFSDVEFRMGDMEFVSDDDEPDPTPADEDN